MWQWCFPVQEDIPTIAQYSFLTPFELYEIVSFTTLLMPQPRPFMGSLPCPVLVKTQETLVFCEIAHAFMRKIFYGFYIGWMGCLMLWTDDNSLIWKIYLLNNFSKRCPYGICLVRLYITCCGKAFHFIISIIQNSRIDSCRDGSLILWFLLLHLIQIHVF